MILEIESYPNFQYLCLEAWHINSAYAPLNRNDSGLPPDAHLHLVRIKAAN